MSRLTAGFLIIAAVIGACVIAEPPADLPTAPNIRPTIIRARAVPKTTGVVTGWPAKFIVPVQLSDPRKTFFASWFVDYNPSTGDGYGRSVQSTPSPGDTNPIRTLELPITQPSADGCHTVEVVVAEDFIDTTSGNGINAHTPSTPGDGDSITWFYSPNGDPSGCPVIDAGLTPIDAGEDGGDGGPI